MCDPARSASTVPRLHRRLFVDALVRITSVPSIAYLGICGAPLRTKRFLVFTPTFVKISSPFAHLNVYELSYSLFFFRCILQTLFSPVDLPHVGSEKSVLLIRLLAHDLPSGTSEYFCFFLHPLAPSGSVSKFCKMVGRKGFSSSASEGEEGRRDFVCYDGTIQVLAIVRRNCLLGSGPGSLYHEQCGVSSKAVLRSRALRLWS